MTLEYFIGAFVLYAALGVGMFVAFIWALMALSVIIGFLWSAPGRLRWWLRLTPEERRALREWRREAREARDIKVPDPH